MYVPLTHNETEKARIRVASYLHGKGLDIGAGKNPVMPRESFTETSWCLTVDKYEPTADCKADSKELLTLFREESFDWVYSSHHLEDYYYWQAIVSDWWKLVRVGGHLILYLPLTKKVARQLGLANWEDFYPNMDSNDPEVNTDHRTDFIPSEVRDYILSLSPAELLIDEIRNGKDDQEYSFLLVFKKLASVGVPAVRITPSVKPNGGAGKKALVIRYGAFGDMVMSTPAIRLLHEQGYTVDVNCSSYGVDVIKENPHVSKILVQERNVIPNLDLGKLWDEYSKHYDRVANLTQSVEDSLLIPDGKVARMGQDIMAKLETDTDPEKVWLEIIKTFRKQFGDKNYYDNHLEKAGLSERGLLGELYFSDIEHRMAHDFLRQHKGKYIVLWSLSGSALHKIYPYFFQTVQGILNSVKDVLVVSVGGTECRILEPPPSGRYLPRSGDWSIRMSMIMTKYADLIIGPETGVLNAAGCYDTPKITLRSHSTHNNLCKYWLNDFCMEPNPERVPCYPCHILHYSDLSCKRGRVADNGSFASLTPGGQLDPEEEFLHPVCMSMGVRPDQIVTKVVELRERFGLRNPLAAPQKLWGMEQQGKGHAADRAGIQL